MANDHTEKFHPQRELDHLPLDLVVDRAISVSIEEMPTLPNHVSQVLGLFPSFRGVHVKSPLTPPDSHGDVETFGRGNSNLLRVSREFKQIATAGATTAAVTEKVWGEYVSTVRQM